MRFSSPSIAWLQHWLHTPPKVYDRRHSEPGICLDACSDRDRVPRRPLLELLLDSRTVQHRPATLSHGATSFYNCVHRFKHQGTMHGVVSCGWSRLARYSLNCPCHNLMRRQTTTLVTFGGVDRACAHRDNLAIARSGRCKHLPSQSQNCRSMAPQIGAILFGRAFKNRLHPLRAFHRASQPLQWQSPRYICDFRRHPLRESAKRSITSSLSMHSKQSAA